MKGENLRQQRKKLYGDKNKSLREKSSSLDDLAGKTVRLVRSNTNFHIEHVDENQVAGTMTVNNMSMAIQELNSFVADLLGLNGSAIQTERGETNLTDTTYNMRIERSAFESLCQNNKVELPDETIIG